MIYWEVWFYDGTVATSKVHLPEEIPDKPVVLIIQLGAPCPEILENIGQCFYSLSSKCWMEMESDFTSLTTRLRIEAKDWLCYRPGFWLTDRAEWKQIQYAARDRLKELKSA